jgi:branched-chain amino acid transport system ATP-binding protein
LAAQGTALLLVEQYVSRALEIADYVFLLNHGRVAFRGEPGELDSSAIFAEYMGVGA